METISIEFHLKFKRFYSRECIYIWQCRLQNGTQFVCVLNNNTILHIVFRRWHLPLHWYTTQKLILWTNYTTGPESPTLTTHLQDNKEWIITSVALTNSGSDIRCAPIRHQTYLSQWWLALVPYVLLALDDLTTSRLVTSCGVRDWTITGACNGLLPDSTKPLSEPTLSCYQWDPLALS